MIVSNITFGAKVSSIPVLKEISGKKVALPEFNLGGFKAMIGCDVFTPECKIEKHDLLFKDKKLIAIDDFDEKNVGGKIDYVFMDGKTVTPAIFDEHIHGGYGVSFHDSSEDEIRRLLKKLANNGTGAVLATTLPGSAEQIRNQMVILNNIIKHPDEGAAKMYGIHLEGPFLSPEKKGIHSLRDLMLPTIENYESFNPVNVKMVTLAPELDKDLKLTTYLQDRGVIVSAGHSVADAKDILDTDSLDKSLLEEDLFDINFAPARIKRVTHIFNAMAPFHHRIPTITNVGLLHNDVTAELLADGISVKPSVINMIMGLKPKDKLVLISDALPNAGLKENFRMNNKDIYIDNNMVPKDADGVLAGNMKFLHDVAKRLIECTNMTFRNFIRYASVNPAKSFGKLDEFALQVGTKPTFSVWDNEKLVPEKTFV